MAQHKVIDLINQFMEDHGQSSGKDRVMLWFEDVYSKIRRLPWSWNFKVTETQTGGILYSTPSISSDSATETFSWTQGNDYIESTATTVAAVDGTHTGRYIYIGEEWYKCVSIAPTLNTDKIYLDKKIVAPSADTQTITFYRRDLSIKGNGIKSVSVDNIKLEHIKEEQVYRFKRGLDPRWYYGDAGKSQAYCIDESVISPPMFAPAVSETVVVGSADAGTHVAFWTFYDAETGEESSPGPSIEFTVDSSKHEVAIIYGSSSGHSDLEGTYKRRLYITKKVDTYTRNKAFLVSEVAGSYATSYTFTSSDATLSSLPSYYDGDWTRVILYPSPDEYLRAEVVHIDGWHGFPEDAEIVPLGRQREFIELFHLYFLMKQSIQNKDPNQFRNMQGSFREQLNFLLAQDGDDRRLDPSSWEYKFYSPMDSIDSEFTSSLKYPF